LPPLIVLAVVLAAIGLGSSAWLVSRSTDDVVASAMAGASALPLVALPQTYADSRLATVAASATAVVYLLAWYAVCVLQRGTLPLHLRATVACVAAVAVLQSVVEGAPAEYVGTGVLVVALGYLAMSLAGHSGTAAVIDSLLTSSGVFVSAAVLLGRTMDAPRGGFIAGHAAATLLWMTAAAYLLIHGLRRVADAGVSLRAGLVLAAVVVGKLMLFDFAALEGMGRVLAFIGSGTLLLAMGTGYTRALDRSRRSRPV
jgi:hypothetical protein